MLGFERDLPDYGMFLTLAILGIASLITTVSYLGYRAALLSPERTQTPKPSILWVGSAFSPSSLIWQPSCH
jgi:hypothetical protein